jgi:hypothetical protein
MSDLLTADAISDLQLWIGRNIKSEFYLEPLSLLNFLEHTWAPKHYSDFKCIVPILTTSTEDCCAYVVYACKSVNDYNLYVKNKFVVQSEFQSHWISYIVDNNVFSFRIWCNIFGVEILRS